MVPSIPEFMSVGKEIYPKHHESVGDMASGLFNAAYSAGALLGPILGGVLDENFGFARAESIYGIVNLGYLFIYLSVGEGMKAFWSKEKNDVAKKDTETIYDEENEGKLKEKLISEEDERVKGDQTTFIGKSSCEDRGKAEYSSGWDQNTIVIGEEWKEANKMAST